MNRHSQRTDASGTKKIFAEKSVSIPKHIAIIMDGNRRWADNKRKPVFSGHKAGTQNIQVILDYLIELKVQFLTLFTFSTENWNRPEQEVNYITKTLLAESLGENFEKLNSLGVKILIKGSIKKLDKKLREEIEDAVEITKFNQAITLVIAFDYGGRNEILEATKEIIEDGILVADINESLFSSYLGSKLVPDPDLIIRTGNEFRLSNFLLWQSAYSEFFTSNVLWPDYTHKELNKALIEYSNRIRRFGAN